jgi:hypothetical protein
MAILYIILGAVELYLGTKPWYLFKYSGFVQPSVFAREVRVNVSVPLSLQSLVHYRVLGTIVGLPAPLGWAALAFGVGTLGLIITNSVIAGISIPLGLASWHALNIAALKEGIIPTPGPLPSIFVTIMAVTILFSIAITIQLAIFKHQYHKAQREAQRAIGNATHPSFIEWIQNIAERQVKRFETPSKVDSK